MAATTGPLRRQPPDRHSTQASTSSSGQPEVGVVLGGAGGQLAGLGRAGHRQRRERREAGQVGVEALRRERRVRGVQRAGELHPQRVRHQRQRDAAGAGPPPANTRGATSARPVAGATAAYMPKKIAAVSAVRNRTSSPSSSWAATSRPSQIPDGDERCAGCVAAGQPDHAPDDRRHQPLRGHVQVAVGLRDHAGREAGDDAADERGARAAAAARGRAAGTSPRRSRPGSARPAARTRPPPRTARSPGP